ncbi:MAG: hypothetical protein HZA90_03865 [Verrucomicrobia bacterium]|nr:hypothetical protein [Verrucomicrobiota bacterium]
MTPCLETGAWPTQPEQLAALNQRVEDLEDLRELNQAIKRPGNMPLVPWAKAKKDLGLA